MGSGAWMQIIVARSATPAFAARTWAVVCVHFDRDAAIAPATSVFDGFQPVPGWYGGRLRSLRQVRDLAESRAE